MNYEEIKQWVKGLLVVAVVSEDGDDRDLWQCLYHIFCGVKMYDKMSAEDRKKAESVIKLTKRMFYSKFSVKETKRKEKKKKIFSPDPSSVEKENIKEKSEKTHTHEKKFFVSDFEEREKAFKNACMAFADRFDINVISDFFNYWSLPNKQKTRMRFERRMFFDIEKMLTRWSQNKVTAENETAAIHLGETKKKRSKETKTMEKQQVVAAARIEHDAKWEQEMAETKRNAVSYEEWLALKAKEPTPDPSRGEGE